MPEEQISEQHSEGEMLRWATFRIAEERYGIDVMQVREVLRFVEITPVPGTRDSVLGIINLRGNVVTVLNTRNLFDLEPQPVSEKTRIVIIESLDQVVGVLVDNVEDVVDLDASTIENTPNLGNDNTNHFFQGISHHNDELLILMNIEQMIESQMPESQKTLKAA